MLSLKAEAKKKNLQDMVRKMHEDYHQLVKKKHKFCRWSIPAVPVERRTHGLSISGPQKPNEEDDLGEAGLGWAEDSIATSRTTVLDTH